MATYAFVDVDIEEASLLADINGVIIDLESVQMLSQYLANCFTSGKFEMEIVDAFSTAILVRYSRPFMPGVRQKIGPDILDALSAHQRKLHEKFMAWRNKHIAHSVNPFEENQVVAYYNDERVSEEGFQSISVQQHRLVGLGSQDLTELQELTSALLKLVNARVDAEKARILEMVRRMPVEGLLAKGSKAPKVPGIKHVDKARNKP